MKTIASKHAKQRFQQRGLITGVVESILAHGSEAPAPGQAMKVRLTKKDLQALRTSLKRTLQMLDKAQGRCLILTGDGSLIMTGY